VTRLLEPSAGKITFEGRDVTHLSVGKMRPLRRDVQMIFQDPFSSLNPRHTVGTIVGAPLRIQHIPRAQGTKRAVQDLLELVGLNPEHYNRYPHEFSGGQRQRIGIARALALRPKLIVCDEPVSALDVSIQAQVVNLLEDLQQQFRLTYLFIAHDLSVVEHISTRVAVMYLGRIVEIAPASDLYTAPLHPYTQALLSAVPIQQARDTLGIGRTKQQGWSQEIRIALGPLADLDQERHFLWGHPARQLGELLAAHREVRSNRGVPRYAISCRFAGLGSRLHCRALGLLLPNVGRACRVRRLLQACRRADHSR